MEFQRFFPGFLPLVSCWRLPLATFPSVTRQWALVLSVTDSAGALSPEIHEEVIQRGDDSGRRHLFLCKSAYVRHEVLELRGRESLAECRHFVFADRYDLSEVCVAFLLDIGRRKIIRAESLTRSRSTCRPLHNIRRK